MDVYGQQDEARKALADAIKDWEAGTIEDAELEAATKTLNDVASRVKAVESANTALTSLGQSTNTPTGKAATIGEHFVKTVGSLAAKSVKDRHMSVTAPEFKAATDTHTVIDKPTGLASVQIDRNIVGAYDYPLTIADWLGSGTMTERALTYFVEKAHGGLEGTFKTVAENTAKPQVHFGGFEEVTETLRKIAGYIKVSTEMMADQEFLVTELNNRLLIELKRFEETQLLKGTGSGQDVKGIMNRTGVQAATYKGLGDLADAIFKACTSIRMATGLDADGIVINPADYQELRLAKDTNSQYYAGGPFQGAYGNGGVMIDPPLWGKRTIVTPAIEAGTVLVGAGKQAATVYRKGGITVATAFQNEDDFVNNRATILAEERLALAVRVPAGFVKLTKAA